MDSGIAAPVDNPQIADVLDSVSYPVVVINDDGLVAYVNTAGCRILGCTLDAVYHQPPMEALPALFGHEFHLRRVSGQFKQPIKYEEHSAETGRWFEIHACPSPL